MKTLETWLRTSARVAGRGVNEVEDCREEETDGPLGQAVERCHGELDSLPASTPRFLCDAGCVA